MKRSVAVSPDVDDLGDSYALALVNMAAGCTGASAWWSPAPLLARSLVPADDLRSAIAWHDAGHQPSLIAYLGWQGGRGNVLVVGAGAVATALLYWARELGVAGDWDIVDGDLAELHNATRCLTMTAADAGWPEGVPGSSPVAKAVPAAEAIGGRAEVAWYDEFWPAHQERHDLVLPLANGRGVRSFVAQRGEPLVLHTTTSSDWTAELHRHRPDLDDCPSCRIRETAEPRSPALRRRRLRSCRGPPPSPGTATMGS